MSQSSEDPDLADDGETQRPEFQNGGWVGKFTNAFAGIAHAVRNENSFYIHLPIAMAVIGFAILLRMSIVQIGVLLLCVGLVLALELINTAFEALARSVTFEYRESIKTALDVSAGAVLVASVISVIVGGLIFGGQLWTMFADK